MVVAVGLGNQAVQRMLEANTEEGKGDSTLNGRGDRFFLASKLNETSRNDFLLRTSVSFGLTAR
jgi:hypothetical protein